MPPRALCTRHEGKVTSAPQYVCGAAALGWRPCREIKSAHATDCRLRRDQEGGKKPENPLYRVSLSLGKMSLANPRSTKRLSGSGGGEHSKRRGPCPGAGYFREPGGNPDQVERSGQQ